MSRYKSKDEGATARTRVSRSIIVAALTATVVGGAVVPPAQALAPGEFALERQLGIGAAFSNAAVTVEQSTGAMVVVDSAHKRVVKFNAAGKPVLTIGSADVLPPILQNPQAAAVDTQGNIFVSDVAYDRIFKFSSTGKLLKSWGGQGMGDDKFDNPFNIALDGAGNVYVSDSGNNCVKKFDNDGTWLGTWGSGPSKDNGKFDYPAGLAVAPNGNVAVIDNANRRVQIFTSDGTYLAKWGSAGDGLGEFSSGMLSIAIDAQNRYYVSDIGANRVQILTATGEPLGEIPYWGAEGIDVHRSSGRLYIGGTRGADDLPDVSVYRTATLPGFAVGPKASATAGKPYLSALQGTGFPAVQTFAVAAGALPSGLKLTGSKISGVPSTPGTYPLILRADNTVVPGAWKGYTIKVVKASSRATAKFSTRTPRADSTRIKARIRVSAPHTTGLSKAGKARVYYGKKRVKTYTVKSAKGLITVRLPKFARPGKTKVTLKYSGNSQLKPAKRTIIVRVR